MNSSYCLNMSLCNNHENNETNISFYNILLNACAGTCLMLKRRQCDLDQWCVWRELSILQRHLCRSNVTRPTLLNLGQRPSDRDKRLSTRPFETS